MISDGGVHVLPPYATEQGGEWYNGTADAIYHNIDFIDNYSPEYVVILFGDHLYKMDYNKMLEFHKEQGSGLDRVCHRGALGGCQPFWRDERGQRHEYHQVC